LRTPTDPAGRAQERRGYVRVRLSLPLQIRRVAGQRREHASALQTSDISSSGVYFLSPDLIEPGTPIELEIVVGDRPFGRGIVRMRTEARVVRVSEAPKAGWYGLAAAFDDISFLRDELKFP
jgi:c-di-GMP-binding flagellar brake protein YcgR